MNVKLSMVLALLIAGVFPALSLYAWQSGGTNLSEDDVAVNVALAFIKNGSTYKFDGIPVTIKVVETRILEIYPVQYIITVTFNCRQAGYGDRKGKVLAQVITPHTVSITVEEENVVCAVIDDKWDELNQCEVEQSELPPPEFAKDLAIEYILQNYPEIGTISLPETWAFEIPASPGPKGTLTYYYVGNSWEVNVSLPPVITPIYIIKVRYYGDVSFTWEGSVHEFGDLVESSTSLKPEILTPEDVIDIVVAYIIENEETMKDLQVPSFWMGLATTPTGLVGYSSWWFESGDWTVNVSYPVVWKPTYEVEIEYKGEVSLYWKGTVDQSGIIEEQECIVTR